MTADFTGIMGQLKCEPESAGSREFCSTLRLPELQIALSLNPMAVTPIRVMEGVIASSRMGVTRGNLEERFFAFRRIRESSVENSF
jgi:hypothetical protein